MKHKFLLLTATLTQLRAEEVPFAFANKNDLLGWTASPAPGGFESASPSRGLSWSKQAMTMTYTLSGYGISHVKVVASSNNANNYVLSVNSGTGQSVPKENNKDFDFDVDVADGGTVTISTTYDGNGKSFYIKSITFTKASGGGDTKPSVPSEQFSWNEAAATVTMGAGDNTYPSLTNSIPVSVTYSSSNTAVATINETSGVIELVKAGSTNISAIFTGNDTYAATTVTYALTVNPAPLTPIAGGVIDELTISDLGVTGGYTAFTDKQASNTDHSDAVYAGTVAKNSDNIQLNSGQTTSKLREIVTTTSGGKAKRVQAIWGGSNTASRKLTVYGSNEAYTGSENAASGTAIGDLVYTAGDTYAYLDIDDDYEYLQIVASGAIYMSQINITWLPGAPAAVAAPTFTPAAGTFDAAQSVTLDCETSGASIYYTLDGTTPTSSSTLYNGAITVSETKTIKAIAIKGSDNSSVATATYTINLPLATMDAIFAAATTAGSTATDVTINFQNWVVSGAKGSTAYVTDGTKGFIIYYSGHGFTAGDILSGSASFKLKLYNGAAEVTAKNSGEVTITKGGTATLNTLDATGISELSGINTGSLIKINGYASQESSKYYVAGVQLYTTLSSEFTYPTAGNEYNCTGVYVQYNSTKEIMPRSAADVEEITEEGAPEAPTFSPAAGTYTAVQSVELSCATDGAAIYYTTDGSVPTASSTPYSSAISVGEDMTIKAIAIKNDKSSSLATAAYTINLPENPETSKTWDLSIDETASASADELTWTATYVDMSYAKAEASSNANNYYPGTSGQSYTSTRFYKNGVITITPNNKQITTIVFTATTSGYATTLANSTWTNATAAASGTTVTVTASGIGAVSATIGNTCGFTAVKVNYTAIDPSIPVAPTFTPAAGTYTSVQSVELSCATDGAAIYYTIDGSTPTSASTLYSGAISVEADMTIKAIAIKDAKSGPVATAAYVINLPVDESTTKTWDLSINETASASADELTWTATYVGMSYAKAEASSPANNYYPGTSGQSYTSTRFYKNGVLTITPNTKQITTIVFTATTAGYATTLGESSWENATADVNDKTVTVTASGAGAVSVTIGNTCGFTAVTVNYITLDPSIPVAPTFTPAAGTYSSVQSVTLACETTGAAIYYTTDGSTPTSESTLYSSAISVGVNMTIKAIAIKDAKSGPVATANYVINLPLTSMDAIFTKATDVKTTATDVNVTFGSWVISGVSTNGKQAYLTDGTKGLIIFDNSAAMGFNVGDVLTGTAACKVQLYNGASELTTLSSTTEGLSVATGGSVTPVVKAISDLSGINTGAPVTINNVWFDGTNLTDGTNSIQPYNTLFAYEEFTENKYYNVTGIYLQFGSKKEILPRKAADIEELSISAPSMIWYTSNAKAVEIAANATHSIGLYEAFAPVFETNSEGAKTYSSTNESVASIDAATGELTVNGVGDTEIRCAVTANGDYAAGSQAFTLHVAENAAEENVVIVAKFGNQWLAMKHDLTAVEVYFAGGKIVNADAETQAAITWKRTVDEENVTFQTSDNKYLKTGSSTTLSVEANASGSYIWTWNSTYYRTGESTRTFLYQGNAAKFKNYTASNAGKASDGGYSELPIVTRAVFTTDAHVRDLTTMTGNYGTICLPYQVNAGDYTGASFYEVAYRDGMETVFVDEVKTLEAGKPYIFVRQQDLLVAVYSGSPVADPISVNGAYGTFSRIEFNNGELTAEDYILSRDMLWKCYADYGLNAYRAYFKVAEITTDVPAPKFGKRRLAIGTPNNTPTELENINNSEIQAVRKIMIDGHLYIVRDGKFFDATGRLVK